MSSYANDLSLTNLNKPIYKAWMRKIRVTLYSDKLKGKGIVFGDNAIDNFNIDIKGSKNLALAEDKGVISITNVEYDTIVKIIALEYYKIEVEVGYGKGNMQTYFKGYVSYISQEVHSRHDTTLYLAYASELVAAYSRARTNFTLNSGINTYAALNYICGVGGIKNVANISTELKNQVLETAKQSSGGVASTIQTLLNDSSGQWITNADSSLGQIISVTDLTDKRRFEINPDTMIITNSNPTVTSNGLELTVMPITNFVPGDIIHIDNGLLNISTSEADVSSSFNANYLDKNGDYLVRKIDYHFQNRGDAFELKIQARALSQFESLVGA